MAALRASYHRILDRIEHILPAKLRPLYNHPAVSCVQLCGGSDVDAQTYLDHILQRINHQLHSYKTISLSGLHESHCFTRPVLVLETLICPDNNR